MFVFPLVSVVSVLVLVVAHSCHPLLSDWLVAAEGIHVVVRVRLVLLRGLELHPRLVVRTGCVH